MGGLAAQLHAAPSLIMVDRRAGRSTTRGRSAKPGNLNYPFRLSINIYRLSLRQLSGSTNRSIRGAAENGGNLRAASTKFYTAPIDDRPNMFRRRAVA
jgi:hypothetical protein